MLVALELTRRLSKTFVDASRGKLQVLTSSLYTVAHAPLSGALADLKAKYYPDAYMSVCDQVWLDWFRAGPQWKLQMNSPAKTLLLG